MNHKKEPTKANESGLAAPPDRTVPYTVRIPASRKQQLKERAARRGTTLGDETARALALYLDESDDKLNTLSPFPDATPAELSLLRVFLSMMRSGDAQVLEVLRGLAGFFKGIRRMKAA